VRSALREEGSQRRLPPNRCFLDAKDISKQIRDGVRDPGLVEEVHGGCHEHSEAKDASHPIE